MKENQSIKGKFLNLIYKDVADLVDRYADKLPAEKEEFKHQLFKVFVGKAKQSFKNGLEVGRKRAKQ